MVICVDAMGGDHAPASVVEGVVDALQKLPRLERIVLVGDAEVIRSHLARLGAAESARLQIVHAREAVTMEDSPMAPLRTKKESSIAVCIDLLKKGEVQTVISAGNTGASVACCVVKLRTLKGIARPGIATVFPSLHGGFVLLDSGATVDVDAETLQQFAVMGSIYAQKILGRDKPRVGLLSNGTEDGKGNEVSKAAFKLLQESKAVNFVGNVEGRDLFEGRVDVAVCDGFVGNIALKMSESIAKTISGLLKEKLKKNPKRMVGAFLAQNAFKELRRALDYAETGGAPLLGVNGSFFKAHGSSDARAIMNAVRVAADFIDRKVNDSIVQAIEKVSTP